jgi:polyhydroxybutyrate depolymerase
VSPADQRACTLACLIAGIVLIGTAGATASAADRADCLSARGRLKGDLESVCSSRAYADRQRTLRTYIGRSQVRPLAVIFVLHGGGGSGSSMELLTAHRFNRIADREGAIVVYPDGVERHWNDGRELPDVAAGENVDDVGFIRALIEDLAREHAIDRGRIFATGISNGGFMSFRLACEAADTFAAVAPVTAALSEQLGPRCKPARSIGIAILNGTEDPLVPWAGGPVKVFGTTRGVVWSTMRTFDRWLELDQCRERTVDPRLDQDPDDETVLITHRGRACRDGVEVRLYELQGGGHTWPSGAQYAANWMVGRVSRELDATEEIWRFMKGHARQAKVKFP